MRAAAVLIGLALTGCSHPRVIQTGPDTYMSGATSMSGFKSDLAVTAKALQNAQRFCEKQGKVAQMTGAMSSGHQMLTAQSSQVSFVCVAPAKPATPASAAE